MAKPALKPPLEGPGLKAARATARQASADETALRKMIDRLHVVVDPENHGDFVELHLDNEAIVRGNGPESMFLREFGRLIDVVKAENNRIDASPGLLTALKELTDEAFLNMTGGKGHLIDNARRAIFKAETGQ